MRTVENSLLLFLSCMLLISCTGKRSDGTIVNNEVALQTEEIHFPQQDVLQLKSYYLSSPVHGDSVNILIGYNYGLHSLDYLDLESKQVTQVTLPAKGPHAISRFQVAEEEGFAGYHLWGDEYRGRGKAVAGTAPPQGAAEALVEEFPDGDVGLPPVVHTKTCDCPVI